MTKLLCRILQVLALVGVVLVFALFIQIILAAAQESWILAAILAWILSSLGTSAALVYLLSTAEERPNGPHYYDHRYR